MGFRRDKFQQPGALTGGGPTREKEEKQQIETRFAYNLYGFEKGEFNRFLLVSEFCEKHSRNGI